MARSCVIIGLGQIGMGYDFDLSGESSIYTHARAISLHSSFTLVGAVDVSAEQRSRFEQRYRAPSFGQIEPALKQLKPDVVVIATSSESHGTVLNQVIRNSRPKLVLSEKPLAYSLDEARAMVDVCQEAGVELFVNYIRRTELGVVEIKRRFDAEQISAPVKGNAWYSKGILNNGSHFLNLLELWLGDIHSTRMIHPGRLWDNHDPEPDFEVQFERGCVIFRSAWEESFSHYSIDLISRSGRLHYDKGGELIQWQGVYEDPNFKGYRILAEQKETLANGMAKYQWHVYEQIHRHLAGQNTTLCTGQQALKTLEAIHSIIKQRPL